jgi:WD40 repeat protein
MQVLTAGTGTVYQIAFAPDGGALAVCSMKHSPLVWELPATGDPVALGSGPLRHVTFSPDSLVVSWASGHKHNEYHRDTGETRLLSLLPETEFLLAHEVAHTGRLVVCTGETAIGWRVRAFDPNSAGGWREAWCVGPRKTVSGSALCVASDRVFLLQEVKRNRHLAVRDLNTGAELGRVPLSTGYLVSLVAPHDGSRVIGCWGQWLGVWNFGAKKMTKKARASVFAHYRALAFHPDGRHVLAGNDDETARVIDTHTWQVVKQFEWAIGAITAVAVSPDGALAAAGSQTGQVVLWDLDL